jgi:hypothetical protein
MSGMRDIPGIHPGRDGLARGAEAENGTASGYRGSCHLMRV